MDLQKLISGLQSKRVEVPPSMNVALAKNIVRHQLVYSLSGLLLGLACVVGGLILFLRGVTGSVSWIAKVLGLESQLTDAAPGVVMFIVGLFVVWVTRFDVRSRN